jgi:hypothetical protein
MKQLEVRAISSKDQVTDIMTKTLISKVSRLRGVFDENTVCYVYF